jgi:hypothetical protein
MVVPSFQLCLWTKRSSSQGGGGVCTRIEKRTWAPLAPAYIYSRNTSFSVSKFWLIPIATVFQPWSQQQSRLAFRPCVSVSTAHTHTHIAKACRLSRERTERWRRRYYSATHSGRLFVIRASRKTACGSVLTCLSSFSPFQRFSNEGHKHKTWLDSVHILVRKTRDYLCASVSPSALIDINTGLRS